MASLQELFHPHNEPEYSIYDGQVFIKWKVSNTGIQKNGEWATDFAQKIIILSANEAQNMVASLAKCLDDLVIQKLQKDNEMYDHHALDGEPPVV